MTGLVASMLRWGRAPHPRIFVSYRRRGEGAGYGGRLADKLVERFGGEQVFRDVDDIESGVDFVQAITDAVSGCEVLIAVIGPDWVTQTDQKGRRRLDDPRDFVRLEVSSALERDIRVIPVLVGGAAIPGTNELPDDLEPLARRQAHELTDTRWDYDVGKLLSTLESAGIKPEAPKRPGFTRRWKYAAGALCAGTLVGLFQLMPNSPLAGGSAGMEQPPVVQSLAHEPANRVDRSDVSGKPGVQFSQTIDHRYDPFRSSVGDQSTPKTVGNVDILSPEPHGMISASWTQEEIVYNAVINATGKYGIARVEFGNPLLGVFGAEQDLTLVRKGDGVFYVGSNPRLPGTNVAHPAYAPDIFQLARMPNGTWAVSAVGSNWGQFGIVDAAVETN